MKHLKLFENYDEKLYTEFYSPNEFREKIIGPDVRCDQFTPGEFKRISSMFKETTALQQHITSNETYLQSGIYIGSDDIYIIKLVDNWFMIGEEITGRYYKCDTIDGVIECLLYIKKELGM
jgi:hypothetical protein